MCVQHNHTANNNEYNTTDYDQEDDAPSSALGLARCPLLACANI